MAIEEIAGILTKGHGYAGPTTKPKVWNPCGTIILQANAFKERGVDVEDYLGKDWKHGTLNVAIKPYSLGEIKSDQRLDDVLWDAKHNQRESFLLTSVIVCFRGREYRGLHWMVDPATKISSPQPRSMVEIVAEPIEGIQYGDSVTLLIDTNKIPLHISSWPDRLRDTIIRLFQRGNPTARL